MNAVDKQNNPATAAADPADDPRLLAAVQEYLALLESGSAPQRSKFVARFPELGPELTRCLEGLELVHQGFRPAPSSPRLATPPAATATGDPLGDYQLLREIGRGGMGVVYEAQQLSLNRRVAVKVLPLAATLDSRHLQRFRHEAQAAAQLHHTNIVPVYNVGCERGVHYYAMQLIDGPSLSALIKQWRTAAGRRNRDEAESASVKSASAKAADLPGQPASRSRPAAASTLHAHETRSALSLAFSQTAHGRGEFFRTIARLMVQAAEAVDYAHRLGIIHRDIKPANLMIDSRDNLWITDFGLAQFRAEGGLTRTGDLVGTLLYMSPEQASGQRAVVDQRADIYALGATLYECLTLEPLFEGDGYHDLLQRILHDEPRLPRALDRAIPVELETIVLKSICKTPQDRYQTAQEMADDLRRFLEDKPILARRPTLVDRTRKWMRRHPGVVAGAVIVLVLVVAGLLVNNWMLAREKQRTDDAYQLERERTKQAEERFEIARRAIELLIQVSQEELADKANLQPIRRRLLEASLVYFHELIEQRKDDPDAQEELDLARTRVEQIIQDLTLVEGTHRIVLIMERSVQNDLALSADQIDEMSRLSKQWMEQRFRLGVEGRRLAADERNKEVLELARKQDKAMRATLSPTQMRRLSQIDLQMKGPFAFRTTEIERELKLSDEQKQKIRQIEVEVSGELWEPRGMGSLGGKGGPGKGGPGGGKFGGLPKSRNDKLLRGAVDRIVAILTPSQRTIWAELTGPAYQGAITGMPFAAPPGGPPHGPPKL